MAEYLTSVLEEKHLISILLFLRENGTCNKTAIYRNISTNPRIPDKLDILEESGLLVQQREDGTQTVWLSLTPTGEEISQQLQDIEDRMYKCKQTV